MTTLSEMQKIKRTQEDMRSQLLGVMEAWDTHEWHQETKYINADLTAIMALTQALINEINEFMANHGDMIEEY